MKKLNGCIWKAFPIEQIGEILSGFDIYDADRIDGATPYVTAKSSSNGIKYFVSNENSSLESECISINRNGSVGYAFYHDYPALYGNDTRKLRPFKKNKHIALFLVAAIMKQKDKYAYGYKMGTARLKKQKIMLPVDNDGNIDYSFMEQYMREIEYKIVSEYQRHIKETMAQMSPPSGQRNNAPLWKAFPIRDIFTHIQRGKRLKTGDHISGKTAYVSSSATDNGIDNFVSNKKGVRIFEDCLTLANSGSVGTAFYHSYSFVASDHVTQLKGKSFNKYIYLFLAAAVSHTMTSKYSFNREINDSRLAREQIMLPVNASGSPDFDFMKQYMRTLEYKQIVKYQRYIKHLAVNAPPRSTKKPSFLSSNRQ